MPTLSEETAGPQYGSSRSSQSFHEAAETPQLQTPQPPTPSINIDDTTYPADRIMTSASAMYEAGNAAREHRGLRRFRTAGSSALRNETPAADEYGSDVVDYLDLVGMLKAAYYVRSTVLATDYQQIRRSVRLVP